MNLRVMRRREGFSDEQIKAAKYAEGTTVYRVHLANGFVEPLESVGETKNLYLIRTKIPVGRDRVHIAMHVHAKRSRYDCLCLSRREAARLAKPPEPRVRRVRYD